jgi:DivIVA domain-containing protein
MPDPHEIAMRKLPVAFRGYDRQEVEAHLRAVAREVRRLQAEVEEFTHEAATETHVIALLPDDRVGSPPPDLRGAWWDVRDAWRELRRRSTGTLHQAASRWP